MNRPASWNFKAILLGFAADFFGSQIGHGIVAIPIVTALVQSGVPEQQIEQRLLTLPTALFFFMIVGLIFTTIGGFVAAHIAGRDELPHAAATGILSLVTGLVVLSLMPQTPVWYNAISAVLVVPCAVLGGFIRSKQPRREQPDSGQPPIPEP